MPGDDVYELYIDAFTPATISMARLADYMRDFAEMLGHPEHVHFDKLKAGSLSLATRVDPVAQNKVAHRVEEIRYGGGPKPALRAKQSLDDRLAEDNAIGRILHRGSNVIEFAGRTRLVEKSSGPVEQADTLVGEVIQVGGRDETINIHLKIGDDVFTHCITSRAVARGSPTICSGARASGPARSLGCGAFIASLSRTSRPWTRRHCRNYSRICGLSSGRVRKAA